MPKNKLPPEIKQIEDMFGTLPDDVTWKFQNHSVEKCPCERPCFCMPPQEFYSWKFILTGRYAHGFTLLLEKKNAVYEFKLSGEDGQQWQLLSLSNRVELQRKMADATNVARRTQQDQLSQLELERGNVGPKSHPRRIRFRDNDFNQV